MAAETSWHRCGRKLRHCHPMYKWTRIFFVLWPLTLTWSNWLSNRQGQDKPTYQNAKYDVYIKDRLTENYLLSEQLRPSHCVLSETNYGNLYPQNWRYRHFNCLTTPEAYSNEDCRRRGTWVCTTCPESLRCRALAVDRIRNLFETWS